MNAIQLEVLRRTNALFLQAVTQHPFRGCPIKIQGPFRPKLDGCVQFNHS